MGFFIVAADFVTRSNLAIALGLFFAGLPYVPLSEAVAIVYSATIFVIVLAERTVAHDHGFSTSRSKRAGAV